MDIYSIGLKVDSRQVKTAQKDLGGMGRQAKKTGNSVSDFGSKVDKSTRSIGGMGKGLEVAKRALGGFTAALAIRQIQSFTAASIAAADAIDNASRTAGIGAERLQELRFAFSQLVGTTDTEVDSSIRRFNRRLGLATQGAGAARDTFGELSVEITDAGGQIRQTDAVLNETLRSLANIESDSLRAAKASEVFGEDAGPKLAAALSEGIGAMDDAASQAVTMSDEIAAQGSRINDEIQAIATNIRSGLQNVLLESIVENEDQLRSLVATTLRGLGTIVQYSDEVAGPLGAGVLGRVLFGTKGAVIGTLIASSVQAINAIIDRANETVGQELARVEGRIESLTAKYEGMDIPPGAAAHLKELRAEQERLSSQVQENVEYQNDYNAAIEEGGDVGQTMAQVFFDAADSIESTGSAIQTIDGPDALPTVVAGMRDLSVAAQEVLGTTIQIPGSLENIADAGEDAGETFAEKFEEQFEELGNSLGEALVDGDWESFGETIGDLIGAELSSVLSDQLLSVFGDIGSDLGGSLGTSIGQGLGTAVGGALGGAAGSFIGQEIGGFLDDALSGSEYDLEAVQARQNTGTVLGSIDQKSSSIDNSLEEIQGATDELVNINTGMLRSLQQVQNGIARASGRIAGQQPGTGISAPAGPSQGQQALSGIRGASAGVFGAAALGAFGSAGASAAGSMLAAVNPVVAAVVAIDAVFDGPISDIFEGIAKTLDDIFGGAFSSIGNAIFGGDVSVVDRGVQIIGGEIGARMDETLIRAFARIKEDGGWFSSDDYYNRFADVPGDVNRQFQLVLGEIVDSVRQGAEALGVLPQNIQQRLDDFVLKTRKISLKGLDADEQQEEIQAAFSAIFDRLAGAVVPFAKDFQNAGEGIGETIARLATQVGVFEEAALTLGGSLTGISGRGRTEAAVDLSESLGGTEQFAQALAQLESNFFTAAEEFEINGRRLRDALGDLPLPETRQGFIDLAKSQDIATASGRDNLATLLSLQNSADEYYDFLEKTDETQKSINEVQQERERLERKLLELQGDTSALRALELDSLDESNRSLQERIWALQDEQEEDREAAAAAEESARRRQDARNEELRLENELLRLQGDTEEIRRRELEQLNPSNRALQERIWALEEEQLRLEGLAGIELGFSRIGQSFEEVMTAAIKSFTDKVKADLEEVGGPEGILNTEAGEFLVDLSRTRDAIKEVSDLDDNLSDIPGRIANIRKQLEKEQKNYETALDKLPEAFNWVEAIGEMGFVSFSQLKDRLKIGGEELSGEIEDLVKGIVSELGGISNIDDLFEQFEASGEDYFPRWIEQNFGEAFNSIEEVATGHISRAISYLENRLDSLESGDYAEDVEKEINDILSKFAEAESLDDLKLFESDLVESIKNIEEEFGGFNILLDESGNIIEDVAGAIKDALSNIDEAQKKFRNDFIDAFAEGMGIDVEEVGGVFDRVSDKYRQAAFSQEEIAEIQLENAKQTANQFSDLEGFDVSMSIGEFRAAFESVQDSLSGKELGQWWAAAGAMADVAEARDALSEGDSGDAAEVARERADLERQLLEVQGKTSEIRQQELDQLDPTNRELQKRIWKLQDEQEVLQERSALESSLLQAYSRTGAIIKQQLAGMTSENAALQIAINLKENVANAQQQVNQAEQDLVGAYEREISSLESRKSVYQDNIETANDLAETWKGLTETLRESADELLGLGVGEPTASRSSFQQTLTAALGGDREAFEALPQLASDLSQAERSQAGTLAEARRANARIASELDKAADQAEKQYLEQLSEKEIAQRSLDRLDEQILQNNRQIEKLTEQELTLEQAKANVAKAEATLKAAQDANTQAINKLQELLPDSIVNGLMEPLSPLQQIDASTQAMVDLLGNLDAGGTVNDTGTGVSGGGGASAGGGASIADADYYYTEGQDSATYHTPGGGSHTVYGSDALDVLKDTYGNYPEFADGGIASGPESGFQATLHGTEAVIPMNGQRIPLEVNNQEMIQELRDLRQEVSQLRTEQSQSQYQITKNTKRTRETLEQFDIEGLPPERSEV